MSWHSAVTACCGQTPLPIALSCCARVRPISGLVTQPAGRPIIHSAKGAARRGLPLVLGSVGLGAATPSTRSQRRIAGAYLPHSISRLWRSVGLARPSRASPARSLTMRGVSAGEPPRCSSPLVVVGRSVCAPPRLRRGPCRPSSRWVSVTASRWLSGVWTSRWGARWFSACPSLRPRLSGSVTVGLPAPPVASHIHLRRVSGLLELSYFRDCPSHAGSVSLGQAMRKMRARWWGAPMSDARRVVHSASYPISVRSPSTRPSARRCPPPVFPSSPPPCSKLLVTASDSLSAGALNAPSTFSHTTSFGRRWLIASRMFTHRLERVPSVMPARFPAADRSWHGEPPVRMSTGSTVSQLICVTSRWLGTPGQWWASTLDGAGSNSQNHAGDAPVTASTARSRPPSIARKQGTNG